MLELIEREAVMHVVKSGVSLAVAWAASHVNGHFGVTINPTELTLSIYAGLEYGRKFLAVKYPQAAPWLG